MKYYKDLRKSSKKVKEHKVEIGKALLKNNSII